MHSWECGYLGIVDHPYFAVSDERGEFELVDVPPGKYVLRATHARLRSRDLEVELGPREQKEVEFSFDR